MSSVNKIHILGRVGKPPEVRNLENGATVATFSVATSETWKDKVSGEKKESTTWHNLVLWRGLAEIAAKYIHKGDLIYVEGKIQTRPWEKDGITRYTTEIIVSELKMLGSKSGTSNARPSDGPKDDTDADGNSPGVSNDDDLLPF